MFQFPILKFSRLFKIFIFIIWLVPERHLTVMNAPNDFPRPCITIISVEIRHKKSKSNTVRKVLTQNSTNLATHKSREGQFQY